MTNQRSAQREWARENMRGLWTSPMVSMHDDFSIDHDGLRHNVDYMVALGAGGLGFGFSEPWFLTIQERLDAFKVFVDAVGGRVPCYLHAVDYSVPETINLVERAVELGADAVMLWAPMEFSKTEDMACEWYEYVASQVTAPIFAYNTYHSGLSLSIEAVKRIAQIPNVVALKDAVNDYQHTVAALDAVGDQIVVSNPLEEYLPSMLINTDQQVLLGATSVYLMQSPSMQPINEYVSLIAAGKHAEAWERYYELKPLRDVWTSIYEVLWVKDGALHPLAIIKYWMDLIGMRGGPVRPPLTNPTDEQKEAFAELLQGTGWMERLHGDAWTGGKKRDLAGASA